jgi:hypothetical protein
MSRPLEDHCADFLAGLAPVSSTPTYRAECVQGFRKAYGDKFAATVKRLAMAKIGGKK